MAALAAADFVANRKAELNAGGITDFWWVPPVLRLWVLQADKHTSMRLRITCMHGSKKPTTVLAACRQQVKLYTYGQVMWRRYSGPLDSCMPPPDAWFDGA